MLGDFDAFPVFDPPGPPWAVSEPPAGRGRGAAGGWSARLHVATFCAWAKEKGARVNEKKIIGDFW